jgi:hypothetical protein
VSFWKRFRDSLRGPMRLEDQDDPELEADIDEEMPDAAEDAEEAREAETYTSYSAPEARVEEWNLPAPPKTIAFEGEEVAASEDAEASDHTS